MADAIKLLPCPMCGGEAALLDYEARYGGLHYASRCPQCTSCGCSMGYLPTAKKAVEAWNCRASLPAREEAPAEEAGELTRGQIINAICNASPFGPDYKHPDLLRMSDAILALRNRTSEPEAAPKVGRLFECKTCKEMVAATMADQCWKCIRDRPEHPNYVHRTSEPEAGEASTFWAYRSNSPFAAPHWKDWAITSDVHAANGYAADGNWEVLTLFTHPAPATADKLRVAKEALERIATVDLGGGFLGAGACRQVAQKALAALNEQPQ